MHRRGTPSRWIAAVGLAVGCCVAAASGCSGAGEHERAAALTGGLVSAGTEGGYKLTAGSQRVDDRTVVITGVRLEHAGWIAIHQDVNGAPGVVIGSSSLLDSGAHHDIAVHLASHPRRGTKVMPVLHVEDNGTKTFDYPDHDAPVTVDGRVVVVTIALT